MSDPIVLSHSQDTVTTIFLRDTLALRHIFSPRCAARIAPRRIDYHHATMVQLHHSTGENKRQGGICHPPPSNHTLADRECFLITVLGNSLSLYTLRLDCAFFDKASRTGT
jgi:DNA-binding FadR family transcriptional regulator